MLTRLVEAGKLPITSFDFKERSPVMQIRIIALLVAMAVLLCAGPAIGHHSNSAYQVEKVMTITGIVKEWKWSNPHTWLYLTVDDEKAAPLECSAASVGTDMC
jgi:hypothetical protein